MAYRQGRFEKLAADVYDVMHEHVSDYITDILLLDKEHEWTERERDLHGELMFKVIKYIQDGRV